MWPRYLNEGSVTARFGVRDFEIQWISGGFLDFSLDFWISGFQSGFLDFKVDFWISSGFLDFAISEDTAKIYHSSQLIC